MVESPYPYFGGKSWIADEIWRRFGDVESYIEPFFGSGAVYLAHPFPRPLRHAVINDKDSFIANFWRAIKASPEAVAFYADAPKTEIDYHSRIGWILNRGKRLTYLLEDPDYYDAKVAGFWLYVMNASICPKINKGPCFSNGVEIKRAKNSDIEREQTFSRTLPSMHGNKIFRFSTRHYWTPLAGSTAEETAEIIKNVNIYQWMQDLALKFRHATILCDDWMKCVKETVLAKMAPPVAIFLDPPYSGDLRDKDIYRKEDLDVSADVRAWCIENGNNPDLRIALCGYEGEHEMPPDWEVVEWTAPAGFASAARAKENRKKERIWFSPHCLKAGEGIQDSLLNLVSDAAL